MARLQSELPRFRGGSMMISALSLFLPFAASESAVGEVRELVTLEFRRLAQFDDSRILWVMLILVGALASLFVVWLYRRENSSLPPALRLLFPCLRLVAWSGAVLFFLGLERRVDQQIVTDSQVILLVDTSQSMSVADENAESRQPLSRGEVVAQALKDSPLVDALRKKHKVALATFDREVRRVASWEREIDPAERSAADSTELAEQSEPLDWTETLQPRGVETRLGDALKQVLDQRREGPLAGIIVITDGVQNSGIEPLSIVEASEESPVPLFPVGVGSNEPRRNLRIQELIAPSRVYPEDRTTITGMIQGEGFAGRTVQVQLYAREADSQGAVGSLVGEEQVSFASDQEVLPVEFRIEPAEVGRLALQLRIMAPREDQYDGDNQREVEVEVVEASTRVLLIAGGASRDYQFLRNQLFRDRHASVDVWIQSAEGGISQEADRILNEFPTTKEDIYNYDCIVAFDPNWEFLDARQAELLESWVAEEAGGLICVAGPIHTQSWSQSPELGKIRALYPVEFQRRLTLLDDGLYGSKTPWPILFSREGEEAEYLWLADSAAESRSHWAEFPGVYGCYAVKGAKPGARVLGWYSDPDASMSADYPVYMAEQFYGSGRVFYLGSGELWRLRSLDPGYFEVLTTRLIRHVSQGRLLKGSSRGRLLVEQDRYSVGDEVVVRAQLLAESREPLIAEQVIAQVVDDQGRGTNLAMPADKSRPGNFMGQFTVKREGSYRIELSIPDAVDEQLVRRIQVVLPDLEFDHTRRNDELLVALASRTGGRYYTNLAAAASGDQENQSVDQLIESRAETRTLRGTPDVDFTEWLNKILLTVICGALCLEWLLRRLVRLA
jgi:hypothetical protein